MSDSFAERLREAASDPFRFDELLEHWNASFTGPDANPVTAAVERAADEALLEIAARDESDLIGSRLRQLIHTLPHAALVVSADGVITAMNEVAMQRTVVGPGDKVDDLPFLLDAAEPLSAFVRRQLEGRNSNGEVHLQRAILETSGRSGTLAILPALRGDKAPSALLFLIDPVWRAEVEVMVARAFGLTSAESAVLMAFLDGQTLAEIAVSRDTTLVTVRTQFQRVMEKTGAHSQAELMRNTLAISTFFSDMAPVADTAGHPHRKQFDIMRPGGRSLDVTLAGDMDGLPVLMVSTLRSHTFPDWYEEELAQQGILAIHVWRPGFAGSDPLPEGQDLAEGMAADILAPLDHLGIKRCPIVCSDEAIVDTLRMARHTGDRIARILSFSTFLPLRLRREEAPQIPWAAAMTRAAKTSPLLLRMIIIAGNKAWQAMGARRFARLQLKASKADLKVIDLPGVTDALQRALLASLGQGLDQNCRTLYDAFGDWSEDLERCPVPIEMVHGDDDPCTSIEDARWMTTEIYPHIQLAEISDAGYLMLFGRPDVLVDRVRAAHAASGQT